MTDTKITRRVRLGDYIEQCDERAGDKFSVDDVVGISIEKKLIPTKANMEGVSLSPYKLLKPNEFCFVTVTSRNGGKISLSINPTQNTFIVSSSYVVFRSKNVNELAPGYLFMLLNREEFDRYSRFNSWGSARETFDWSEMCRVEIPLPSIEVQRELVEVYNGLKELAEQNEALMPQLSAACHAYIVDCRDKYPSVTLGDYIEEYNVINSDNSIKTVKSVSVFKEFRDTNAKVNKEELSKYKIVQPGMMSYVQTTKNEKCFACCVNHYDDPIVVTSVNKVFYVTKPKELNIDFLFLFLNRKEFDRFAIFNSWGSAREVFQWGDLKTVQIPLPPIEVQQAIVDVYQCAERAKQIAIEARERMKNLCPALVQRAANS